MPRVEVPASEVFATLKQNILVDGFHVVIDLAKSVGNHIVDAVDGKRYLDFYSYFASAPIGHNHPKLIGDAEFMESLRLAAISNPANADIYSREYAGFVKTFRELAVPPEFNYLFFVAGGSLAVENAMKTAFDWKVRKNKAAGKGEKGQKILHFRQAFHGRSGYTMSVTNTDPNKVAMFPKFDWPRVSNPAIRWPLDGENGPDNLKATIEAEEQCLREINAAFDQHPDDIAAILLEPIQGEGGDNHFRGEFFGALRKLADEREALLIFDEVQTGMGMTGKMWAFDHYRDHGAIPDILAFGKKTQVCGIMVGKRIDEVKDNVFKKSSRINSTWGGNLVDMVRCAQYLRIIHEDNLVANAAAMGEYFVSKLHELATEFEFISAVRGLGLFIAFSLPDSTARNQLRSACWQRGLATLTSGERAIRFRPCLTVSRDEIDEAIGILRESLAACAGSIDETAGMSTGRGI